MAFASRAIPIAYRTSTMGYRSPDRMPIDRARYELEPITSLRDLSWGDAMRPSFRNFKSLRTDTPPVLSKASRSTSSLFHTPTPGTPSFLNPSHRTLSREGRKSSSPTFASEMRARPHTPTDIMRPSTPGTFWKPSHQPFDIDISPDAVSRQGCIPRHPLVWKPAGSDMFPVSWHDSPQLREPLKSSRLVASLRSNSAAVLRPRPCHKPPPIIHIKDSERVSIAIRYRQSSQRASGARRAQSPARRTTPADEPSMMRLIPPTPSTTEVLGDHHQRALVSYPPPHMDTLDWTTIVGSVEQKTSTTSCALSNANKAL